MDLRTFRLASTAPLVEAGRRSTSRLWRELLGEQLRAVRHERGETLEAIARRARVSLPYLSEIERGLKEPSSEIIEALCAALQISLVDLAVGMSELARTAPTSRGAFELAA